MDDLIPFLIFIGVALINLVKTAIERGGAKKAPPPARRSAPPSRQEPTPPTAPTAPNQGPTTLEEFFEEIAEKFGADVEPDEPLFEEPQPVFETPPPPRDPQPVLEPQLPPIALSEMIPAKPKVASLHQKALGSALKSMPNTLISFNTIKLPSVPLISNSQAGNLNFPLRERDTFRNAIIANTIFSPPRALDTQQQNTHLS